LWIIDVGDGMSKVRETVPDVLSSGSTRLPETGLKVTLCYLNIMPQSQQNYATNIMTTIDDDMMIDLIG